MVLEDQAMVALAPWGWDKLGLMVENGSKAKLPTSEQMGRKKTGKDDKNGEQEEEERARKQTDAFPGYVLSM